jgi:hypothetical protein
MDFFCIPMLILLQDEGLLRMVIPRMAIHYCSRRRHDAFTLLEQVARTAWCRSSRQQQRATYVCVRLEGNGVDGIDGLVAHSQNAESGSKWLANNMQIHRQINSPSSSSSSTVAATVAQATPTTTSTCSTTKIDTDPFSLFPASLAGFCSFCSVFCFVFAFSACAALYAIRSLFAVSLSRSLTRSLTLFPPFLSLLHLFLFFLLLLLPPSSSSHPLQPSLLGIVKHPSTLTSLIVKSFSPQVEPRLRPLLSSQSRLWSRPLVCEKGEQQK